MSGTAGNGQIQKYYLPENGLCVGIGVERAVKIVESVFKVE